MRHLLAAVLATFLLFAHAVEVRTAAALDIQLRASAGSGSVNV